MIKVNDEMLRLYWDLGHDIVVRQMDAVWDNGFYKNLSKDLKSEFPDMEGFSKSNLYYMRQFYLFYSKEDEIFHQLGGKLENENLPQLGAEIQVSKNKDVKISRQLGDEFNIHPIFQIPWRHHVEIFTRCKSVHEALFYVQKTIKNGWSRAVLMNFIEADLYNSQGKAINNFDRLLPDVQSDLAKETLKDPYNFDFITLTEKYKEKELEDALVENITKFLLELGQGFAFVGRQYPIKTGKKPRNIDLLFYHIDAQYSLESSSQPIGISEYTLSKLVPENFKSSLPSIEEIERELNKDKKEE